MNESTIKRQIVRLLRFKSGEENVDELWNKLESADWQLLVDIALENRVMPFLSYKIRELGLENRLIPEIWQTIYQEYQKGTMRNVILKYVLKDVIRSLNKDDVKAIMLKGAITFCEEIYQVRNMRSMEDLDILIQEEDFPAARKCLLNAGMRYTGGRVPSDLHEDFESKGVTVELHYLPVPVKYINFFDMELFWSNAIDVEIDGLQTYIPSPTDQIYHSFIHTMIRHQELINFQIQDLNDFVMVAQFYRERIEWEEIMERVHANDIGPLFKFYSWQVTRNFGFSLPNPIHNLNVEETVRYEKLYNRLKNCPGWLESASERLISVLIRGDNLASYFKNTFKILIKESILDESKEFLVSIYNLEGKRFLLPVMRVIHFCRVIFLHILIVGYFANQK